jgi:hypothetical protein
MPAAAPLEELERANEELQSLEMKFPDAYEDFAEFFRRNRSLGYNNLCKMLMGEQTPKQLKGLDDDS